MATIDGRLLREGRPARGFLLGLVLLGLVAALLSIAQAWLLADVVAGVVHQGWRGASVRLLAVLLLVLILRALLPVGTASLGHRSSAVVKSSLRRRLLQRVVELGPSWLTSQPRSELETLATRGLDALDPYFARYVPHAVLAAVVPPLVVVAAASQDLVAAGIMTVTLPLVPGFMVLIGLRTRATTTPRLEALRRLAGRFLDSVAGLPTLKTFGASARAEVAESTDALRRRTMATLRVTFLSSLVLELATSLSVALVAVSVGIRLVGGTVDLRTGLLVIVLAPEAYQPLRTLAAQFHASEDGRAAAAQVYAILDAPQPLADAAPATAPPDVSNSVLQFEAAAVHYPGRRSPAFEDLSFTVSPGEVVALVGPSGCGKSTALAVLLRFVDVASGRVTVADQDLRALDPRAWRSRIAWVPQQPHLFARSLRDNIVLARPDARADQLAGAVEASGLAPLVARLPDGLDTRLGENGYGLSAGEGQRVALARAFLLDAPLLVLDEPTAHLDGETEAGVLASVRTLCAGRTVVMAAHRRTLVEIADSVVEVTRTPVGARA